MRPVVKFLVLVAAIFLFFSETVFASTPADGTTNRTGSGVQTGSNTAAENPDEITVLLSHARVLLRKGSIDSAMIMVFEARNATMEISEPRSIYFSAQCNHLLGEICYTRFIEDEAIRFYLLAFSQYRQAGDLTGVAEILNAISITSLNDKHKWLSKKALKILSDIGNSSSDPYLKGLDYEARGDFYDFEGHYLQAAEMFRTAGYFYSRAGKTEKVSDVILSRALSEFSEGHRDVALALTDSAKQWNTKNGLRKNYLEAVYYQAEFIGSENPAEAIEILKSTLDELYKSQLNIHLGIYLKLMVRLQKQTGDYKSALESTDEFHRVLNDIYGSDAERKIASLQLEVETGKLNHRINLLQKEQELSSANARSQRNMLFYFFLATIVLFMMALNNMRRLQYRLYLLKEFTLDFPIGRYLMAFILSLAYYSIILYFVNPLNLTDIPAGIHWLHYSIIGFITSALTTTGIILLPAQWSAKPGFNKRFSATAMIFILIINAVVILYSMLAGVGSSSWIDYLNVILVITGITIIPLFFTIIFLEKVLLRKHIQLAGLLSNRINKVPSADTSDTIELYSDRSKDVLNIKAANLIMIEAAGNYAKICYTEENKTRSTLILATMKLLESQLSGYPQFSRCHKSYIVNLKKVKKVLGNSHGYKLEIPEIDYQVPVSRSYAETFIKSFDKVYREK
ncbi:hypothetical protein SDC9_78654 [bioreactor metagenome]|uniref:HTH LytTR-type domain-containing protein n=1 Tax=bioreactor metagenome TaxID=1076179 RepID=A0A644YU38_9ZZZZ